MSILYCLVGMGGDSCSMLMGFRILADGLDLPYVVQCNGTDCCECSKLLQWVCLWVWVPQAGVRQAMVVSDVAART